MVQVNNTPIVLRVKFKKLGKLQYISHLDLVRTMHKTVIRSKLPLWYTEGFNPKPKMVFAAPLSIGTESVCEYMDLRLSERISEDEAVRLLNNNVTDELRVIEAYYPERKLTELKWLEYTVLIKTNGASAALAAECERYLLDEHIEIKKRSKSGDVVSVDIRPLVKNVKASFEGEVLKLSCILSGDQSCFLNPEHVISALKEKFSILSSPDLTSEYYSIMREKAYLADMSEFR